MIVSSNYAVIGVSRRHFLKVRSTLVCGQFVVVLVQFRHFCFLVKWFCLQWLKCSKSLNLRTLGWHLKQQMVDFGPQLEDSRLTSEATDGWLRVHEGPHWHICDVGWHAMPTSLDNDLFCPNRFPLCSPFSKKSACFKFFKFYMPSSLSNHQSASGQSREGSCGVSV